MKKSKIVKKTKVNTLKNLFKGAFLAFAAVSTAAHAAWPDDKVIRLVIPFSVGGATDLLGRTLAAELGKGLNKTVIVENKVGAGGALGAQSVATSPADGYTILLASSSQFTVNPHIYSNLPYTLDKFSLISEVAAGPMILTVNSKIPVKNAKELIDFVGKSSRQISFSSAGVGSQTHIAAEALVDSAKMKNAMHVPYKGEGPAYSDLMGGVIDFAVANINAISPLLKGDKLTALAVTGKERHPLFPDVPTLDESGVPGFEFNGWFALMTPAGTPKNINDTLLEKVKEAVQQPNMVRYLEQQGMVASVHGPEKLKSKILLESDRWKDLVTRKNITAN